MWTCQNSLSLNLCTILSDCHMVATSDKRKKSEIKVSTNLCVTIKH